MSVQTDYKQQILGMLDAGVGTSFPDLGHGYNYAVGAKLSVYRGTSQWAMLFETLCCSPRAGMHGGIMLTIHAFGNCIREKPRPPAADFFASAVDENFVEITSDGPEGATFDGGTAKDHLLPSAQTICVQGQLLPVEQDPSVYKRHEIPLADDPKIEPHDLLRLLYPRFREVFYLRDEQLRARLTVPLPLVLRLYGWQHPRILEGELPSQSPSLIAIAEAIQRGDFFNFTDPGTDNVHWRNWPQSGML